MTAAFGIDREYPDEANGITRVSCITRAEWEEGRKNKAWGEGV